MGKLTDTAAASPAVNSISKAPTSEQLRIAQLLVDPKSEDHSVTKDKINKVMELTRCNESTALVALHDCDNDVEKAVDKLLEGGHQDEWIVKGGKKSKKVQQQQHTQQSHNRYRQNYSSTENHHCSDEAEDGKDVGIATDGNSASLSAHHHARGSARDGVYGGSDFAPRFRGRGGGSVRNPRRHDKENEPFESSADAERGRWHARGRGVGTERGRGRGFSSRGGRRGGGFARTEGGFDQEMGSWNTPEMESNTWDNSMATSCNTKATSGAAGRQDGWKTSESNTWDNSMAQAAASTKSTKKHQSNEWNSSTDDWGGEEDWSKLRDGLIIEPSGLQKQRTGPTVGPASSHTSVPSYAAVSTNAGNVRGESIDVNMLFTNQLSENQPSNSQQAMWAAKQATADLKNELGIGKVSQSPHVNSVGHARQVDPLSSKQIPAKVELPSIGGCGAVGPIDVQFGDMTLLSDSQSLFPFDGSSVFKPASSTASSQPQGQIDSSSSVFQRTQKNDHVNGPDLLLGTGENIKVADVSSSAYAMGGGYASGVQAQPSDKQQSLGSAGRSMAVPVVSKGSNSGVASLTSAHQRGMLSSGSGGGNLPAQVPMNESVQPSSKDIGLSQSGVSGLTVGSSTQGLTTTANFGLSSAQGVARSPANAGTGRPQVSSSVSVNSNVGPYQQAMAAASLSPYLNMYDQMSLNSVGFLPAQNLFLNAGGFDVRALTQMPPIAGSNAANRDSDVKASFMRQDTGSNLAAAAAGLANLSVPPPGLPAPTVSNAEQAAQILSMAGMYPTLPFINAAAPPFLAPQFLVPNVSSSATVTTGSQYQRAGGFQAPVFSSTGYEDLQLSQDFNKGNYAALSSGSQTKTVSSAATGLTLGVNDGNKAFAGGLKGSFDTKSFVQATATPPPLSNMTFPAPFQTTAATGVSYSYGYPNYMPPINMNMLASPMAAAMASNVQLSNDVMGTGTMNQYGANQNAKAMTSSMGKPLGQYPFPSWGN